jgi:hypothetical protein
MISKSISESHHCLPTILQGVGKERGRYEDWIEKPRKRSMCRVAAFIAKWTKTIHISKVLIP